MKQRLGHWLVLGAILTVTAYAAAEDVTITTYYPSPRGVYQELRSQRVEVTNTTPNDHVVINGLAPSLKLENPAGTELGSLGLVTAPSQFILDPNVLPDDLVLRTTSAGGDLILGTGNTCATTSCERMRITPAGNVGIGTPTPAAALHVADDTPFATIRADNTRPSTELLQVTTLEMRQRTAPSENLNPSFIISSRFTAEGDVARTSEVQFLTAADETFGTTMTLAGRNVGIGTPAPAAKLAVAGQATFGPTAFTPPGPEPVSTSGPGSGISMADRNGTSPRWIIYPNADALRFFRDGSGDQMVIFDDIVVVPASTLWAQGVIVGAVAGTIRGTAQTFTSEYSPTGPVACKNAWGTASCSGNNVVCATDHSIVVLMTAHDKVLPAEAPCNPNAYHPADNECHVVLYGCVRN